VGNIKIVISIVKAIGRKLNGVRLTLTHVNKNKKIIKGN